MIKKILKKIKNRTRWLISFPVGWFYKLTCKPPQIIGMESTLQKIISGRCSVSRYGDGEFDIMAGRDIGFQPYNMELAEKMKKILHTEEKDFLVCINESYISTKNCTDEVRKYWKKKLRTNRHIWDKLLKNDKIYYSANITRFYFRYKDKTNVPRIVELWKLVWAERDIVFIEGEKSRLGVGNDFFDGAKSCRRILCPPENAFEYYDEIIAEAKKIEKSALIFIALGPTATAMAYDLYVEGYQAIDIGHIDIEYEWYLMGSSSRIAIKDKYTNEAVNGTEVGQIEDERYQKQIISIITN